MTSDGTVRIAGSPPGRVPRRSCELEHRMHGFGESFSEEGKRPRPRPRNPESKKVFPAPRMWLGAELKVPSKLREDSLFLVA
jgi:hypothetical protein